VFGASATSTGERSGSGTRAGLYCFYPGRISVAKVLSRVFAADEIDAVRRQLGQVKDLAHSGQDPTVQDQIFEMHALGFGPCRIARETGLNRKQVTRVLASGGITRRPSVPASTLLPQILELRRQGKSNAEVGRALGFSRKAICRALKRLAGPKPA
jgi:DNA invertase Pin-like site-specific DNA recombinase